MSTDWSFEDQTPIHFKSTFTKDADAAFDEFCKKYLNSSNGFFMNITNTSPTSQASLTSSSSMLNHHNIASSMPRAENFATSQTENVKNYSNSNHYDYLDYKNEKASATTNHYSRLQSANNPTPTNEKSGSNEVNKAINMRLKEGRTLSRPMPSLENLMETFEDFTRVQGSNYYGDSQANPQTSKMKERERILLNLESYLYKPSKQEDSSYMISQTTAALNLLQKQQQQQKQQGNQYPSYTHTYAIANDNKYYNDSGQNNKNVLKTDENTTRSQNSIVAEPISLNNGENIVAYNHNDQSNRKNSPMFDERINNYTNYTNYTNYLNPSYASYERQRGQTESTIDANTQQLMLSSDCVTKCLDRVQTPASETNKLMLANSSATQEKLNIKYTQVQPFSSTNEYSNSSRPLTIHSDGFFGSDNKKNTNEKENMNVNVTALTSSIENKTQLIDESSLSSSGLEDSLFLQIPKKHKFSDEFFRNRYNRMSLQYNGIIGPSVVFKSNENDFNSKYDYLSPYIVAPLAPFIPLLGAKPTESLGLKIVACGLKKGGKLPIPKTNYFIDKGNFGDDAGFHSENSLGDAIGIADGASGNRNLGYDPGDFSRNLMQSCSEFFLNENKMCDAKSLLLKAYDSVQDKTCYGSCTACVMTLDRTTGNMTVANVGDSGYCLFRNGRIVQKSEPQRISFDCPKQLDSYPWKEKSRKMGISYTDILASDTICEHVRVQKDDLIILSTDGLYDNLLDMEIEEICQKSKSVNDAAENLVHQSVKLYRKPDDILVILAKVVCNKPICVQQKYSKAND